MNDRAKQYFYDGIAADFDRIMNPYEVGRRLEIVFDELLGPRELTGKSVLDVGTGTGRFAERAAQAGARVIATDIGINLLRRTRARVAAPVFAADACQLPLQAESFDVVVSSECIEHTRDPLRALREMCRVVRRPGVLVVTTPNRAWHFSVAIARRLRLRPYDGFENWVGRADVKSTLAAEGLTLSAIRGFHLVPPLFKPLRAPLRRIDRYGTALGPVMLNVAVRAEKR